MIVGPYSQGGPIAVWDRGGVALDGSRLKTRLTGCVER